METRCWLHFNRDHDLRCMLYVLRRTCGRADWHLARFPSGRIGRGDRGLELFACLAVLDRRGGWIHGRIMASPTRVGATLALLVLRSRWWQLPVL